MKYKSKSSLVIGLLLLAGCDYVLLWRGEQTIREFLLTETPVGSTWDDVREYLRNTSYKVIVVSEDVGKYTGDAPRLRYAPKIPGRRVIGAKFIRARLGSYRGGLFRTYVTAYWIFDEKGSLIDIHVWKSDDTL